MRGESHICSNSRTDNQGLSDTTYIIPLVPPTLEMEVDKASRSRGIWSSDFCTGYTEW
jgi:hypothetical protein